MDGEHFDQLTKGLATGVNRRNILKGLVGAAMGIVGFAGHRAATPAQGDLGSSCTAGTDCISEFCCPAGTPRQLLCGIATGEACPTGSNNACCSGSCVEGVCRDRSTGVQGVACDVGDQADCADGFTCCDNYTDVGPDFFCTDTTSDPLNCGGCSQTGTGGQICGENEACVNSICQCAEGFISSPVTNACIAEGTCPSGSADECGGVQQVCCSEETDKPFRCVGQGRDGGNRACFRGK
jgi:hypothetical protein